MPIDPRIPLGVQQFEAPDPMRTLAQVYQLQNMQQQQELARERIALSRQEQQRLTAKAAADAAAEARAQEKATRLSEIFTKDDIDPKEVYSVAGPKDGAAILSALEDYRSKRITSEKDAMSYLNGQLAGLLVFPTEESRAQMYPYVRNRAIEIGAARPESVPEQYPGLGFLQSAQQQLLSAEKQWDIAHPPPTVVGRTVIQDIRHPEAPGGTFTLPAEPAGPAKPGTFEYFLTSSYGATPTPQQQGMARKAWEDAGRAPVTGQDRNFQPRMIKVNGQEVQANYDSSTGHYFDPDTGARLHGVQPPDTAEQRNKAVGRRILLRSRDSMMKLSDRIIAKIGPAQRADALKRGAEAVFGHDPEFRTYQDARLAYAGNLAVAQQGTRPSDSDIKAIWLPMVPDAYRDTKESKDMKFKLMDDFMDLKPAERGTTDAGATGGGAGGGLTYDDYLKMK